MKIGVVPTKRNSFNHEEPVRQKNMLLEVLKNYEADFIDINDINEDGLLFDEADSGKIINKLQQQAIDGVFFPHCNFGSEGLVAKIAKALNKPVLLWGPRDDAPLADGMRTRDTQCGLFATGKVLRRFNIPFSYITNSHVNETVFKRGIVNFIQVCSAVNALRNLKILQIAPRPAIFWTMMCNEGELLEKFGIQIHPITLQDIATETAQILKEKSFKFKKNLDAIHASFATATVPQESLNSMAALYTMIEANCENNHCSAVALQCWDALQNALSIAPCAVNGLLTDHGIPVACETDIHGAISSVLLQEANMGRSPAFIADFTIRHPEKDNVELLWHCGNFPPSLAKKPGSATIGHHFNFPNHDIGVGEFEIKGGDITLCRFDGDHGEYSLLIGEGKGTNGPKNMGTYIWYEVKNWPKWENKLVTGPYVHHCSGIHAKLAPVLFETCKYITGLNADPVEPGPDEISDYLYGK
jgi:L-fucose isomerase-like protein